jgi:hypothetical protein
MDNRGPKNGVRSRWDLAARVLRPRQGGASRDRRPDQDPVTAPSPNGTAISGASNRSVDVFCSGMYRACSTWQYEVVAHILERHAGGRRLGYLSGEQYRDLVRKHTGSAVAPAGTGWRVLKSHEGDRSFSRALTDRRALAVYAFRDVRDVVFSLMHKRGLTFEQLLRQGMIHQILANDRFWMRQSSLLVQRYEEILAEPVGGVRDLAGYLRIELEEGEAEQIAKEYSLESNKARTEALRRRLEQVGVDLNEAANAQICDSTTLLHWNHVRTGNSGSWYAEATPRQRWILLRLCGPWLKARNYPLIPDGSAPGVPGDLSISVRDRFRIEADLIVGWLNHQVRTASQRFPQLALSIKRLLGIPTPPQVGATVFSDAKPESPVVSTR